MRKYSLFIMAFLFLACKDVKDKEQNKTDKK